MGALALSEHESPSWDLVVEEQGSLSSQERAEASRALDDYIDSEIERLTALGGGDFVKGIEIHEASKTPEERELERKIGESVVIYTAADDDPEVQRRIGSLLLLAETAHKHIEVRGAVNLDRRHSSRLLNSAILRVGLHQRAELVETMEGTVDVESQASLVAAFTLAAGGKMRSLQPLVDIKLYGCINMHAMVRAFRAERLESRFDVDAVYAFWKQVFLPDSTPHVTLCLRFLYTFLLQVLRSLAERRPQPSLLRIQIGELRKRTAEVLARAVEGQRYLIRSHGTLKAILGPVRMSRDDELPSVTLSELAAEPGRIVEQVRSGAMLVVRSRTMEGRALLCPPSAQLARSEKESQLAARRKRQRGVMRARRAAKKRTWEELSQRK